jgi:hypothetical protein
MTPLAGDGSTVQLLDSSSNERAKEKKNTF